MEPWLTLLLSWYLTLLGLACVAGMLPFGDGMGFLAAGLIGLAVSVWVMWKGSNEVD